MPKGAVAIRHRLERDRSHVAIQRHRGIDDAIRALVLMIVELQKLLADAIAVLQREAANATNLVTAFLAFDAAGIDHVVPMVVAIEVAQHRPHTLDRRVDDGAANDALQH